MNDERHNWNICVDEVYKAIGQKIKSGECNYENCKHRHYGHGEDMGPNAWHIECQMCCGFEGGCA